MNLEETIWLVLPPPIRERLESHASAEGLLPPNMLASVVDRLRTDKKRKGELLELAGQFWDHLDSDTPGWALALWPADYPNAFLSARFWPFG